LRPDSSHTTERTGPYRDDAGKVFDFHALRHTFIANVGRSGVPFRTQQELARHSTPVLTSGSAHWFKQDKLAAIGALSDLDDAHQQEQCKTGTEDAPRDDDKSGREIAPEIVPNSTVALRTTMDDNGPGVIINRGGVPEWPKGPVLKTGAALSRRRGFESHPHRFYPVFRSVLRENGVFRARRLRRLNPWSFVA